MPFGRRQHRPTLFQLQDQWDDARARARIAALRADLAAQTRQDRRWMPLALYLAAVLAVAFAALMP